jgi:hypothetical protein
MRLESFWKEVGMKSILGSTFGSAIVALMMSSSAMAAPKYQCIADSLEAINSDIYYQLSEDEVQKMLQDPSAMGHTDAVAADERCSSEAAPVIQGQISDKGYQCIADRMDAYDSDLYYNLSHSDIDKMLSDEESYGHWLAVREAKACGVR